MRTSKYLLSTLKETPNDAQVVSHQLMLRAGMIRPLASGLYNYLPTGLKVLKKVENIVREEMNKVAVEISMPVVQPADLWIESKRWNDYGPELLRIKDRGDRSFVLGPTHEEVVTDLFRNEVNSYKQLPLNLYQIQTKFRDEVRPRFGVMRAREFLMKDAYSFHLTQESLQQTYDEMYQAYCNIFNRLGLDFRPVVADTGSIGGSASHEFQVLAQSGEDDIVFSTESDFAANIELAPAVTLGQREKASEELRLVDTPNAKTINDLTAQFNLKAEQIAKTLVVKGSTDENPLIALVLRGDHELNEVKAQKLPEVFEPLTFATDEEIFKALGVNAGSIGLIDLKIPCVVDNTAANLSNFVCGGNENGKHYFGVNFDRDVTISKTFDLRNVKEGEPSPDGKGTLLIKRGIEVGHIFQLGNKYSQALNATVQGEDGKPAIVTMGCYGIGVSRVVAAAIEQNFDERGIIFPDAIAPFTLAIVPMNMHKSDEIRNAAEKLYQECLDKNIDVIFDDRKERAGVMFADMELIGVPHMVIIGAKSLESGCFEYKNRKTGEKELVKCEDIFAFLSQKITA